MKELLGIGASPDIADDEIDLLHSYSIAHGRSDIQVLCEIAMGGVDLTADIARHQLAAVMADIRRQRAEAASTN